MSNDKDDKDKLDEFVEILDKLRTGEATIYMCPTEGIDSFDPSFVLGFLTDILGDIVEEPELCFISDESCLLDFSLSKEEDEELYVKIDKRYGVDVRHCEGNLLRIFQTIHNQNRTVQ